MPYVKRWSSRLIIGISDGVLPAFSCSSLPSWAVFLSWLHCNYLGTDIERGVVVGLCVRLLYTVCRLLYTPVRCTSLWSEVTYR